MENKTKPRSILLSYVYMTGVIIIVYLVFYVCYLNWSKIRINSVIEEVFTEELILTAKLKAIPALKHVDASIKVYRDSCIRAPGAINLVSFLD